ncbi:MAG TPA: hypothetical protein VN380_10070 [Thermoanaerobaculia bacterium]|jgi:hypothetical protein|nr:hypothetical protein [Thermoanaerobaculia bacterium]
MANILKTPESGDLAEAISEHLELAHYVDIYRRSAERVRYVVFVMMVLSIIVLIAQWNTDEQSWRQKRYNRFVEIYNRVANMKPVSADQEVQNSTRSRYKSRDELRDTLADYRRLGVENVYIVGIPGLGATFDVNDLGVFSGIAFVALLALLAFSVMREYENLYLALFKVRHLHDAGAGEEGGASTANYLYHALAMSQVFSAPPTLAVWSQSWLKRNVPNIVFFIPTLVQFYIIYTNYKTLEVLQLYKRLANAEMMPQYILGILIVFLGAFATVYAEACNYRWRSAFIHVNPAFRRVDPMPWIAWVRLKPLRGRRFGDYLERHLRAQAVQRLKLATDTINDVIELAHTVEIDKDSISYLDVGDMCGELKRQAFEIADRECEKYHFVRNEVVSSILDGRLWQVKARFYLSCIRKSA